MANDIRLAMISLAKHITSHITVAGNRVLVSYDGQPMTCYGCNETGHLYNVCPIRRRVRETVPTAAAASWADIAAGGTRKTRIENEDTESKARQCGQAGPADGKCGERDDTTREDGNVVTHDDQGEMKETMQAMKCSRETPETEIHQTPEPGPEEVDKVEWGRSQGTGTARRMSRNPP